MKPRHHPRRRSTHKYRHAVAAVVAIVLGILAAPAALAEPYEYLNPHDEASAASSPGNAHTEWPQRQLEYLKGQEAYAGADDASFYRAQQEAYLRFLEQKAEAASGGEPAAETSADDAGQPWLVGGGAVAIAIAIAIASIVLAIVRSRRSETVTAAQRDRDQVSV